MSESARERSTTRSYVAYRDCCAKCGAQRVDQQLGMEATPDEFVAHMVEIFREVRRILAPHGSCWVNLGDTYAANRSQQATDNKHPNHDYGNGNTTSVPPGLKSKDLVGIPWRVALALQADGWWLRSDIIWSKRNPMPSSVTDRPTTTHEYIFMLTKKAHYYFDQEAVREPYTEPLARWGGAKITGEQQRKSPRGLAYDRDLRPNPAGRNIRSVWEMVNEPYEGAHFAVFPSELVRKALLAGCPERVCQTCGKPSERITTESEGGKRSWHDHSEDVAEGMRQVNQGQATWDTYVPPETIGWSDCGHERWRAGVVLDPFMGSGTTALVARNHQRHAIGIELSEAYAGLCAQRLQQLSLFSG